MVRHHSSHHRAKKTHSAPFQSAPPKTPATNDALSAIITTAILSILLYKLVTYILEYFSSPSSKRGLFESFTQVTLEDEAGEGDYEEDGNFDSLCSDSTLDPTIPESAFSASENIDLEAIIPSGPNDYLFTPAKPTPYLISSNGQWLRTSEIEPLYGKDFDLNQFYTVHVANSGIDGQDENSPFNTAPAFFQSLIDFFKFLDFEWCIPHFCGTLELHTMEHLQKLSRAQLLSHFITSVIKYNDALSTLRHDSRSRQILNELRLDSQTLAKLEENKLHQLQLRQQSSSSSNTSVSNSHTSPQHSTRFQKHLSIPKKITFIRLHRYFYRLLKGLYFNVDDQFREKFCIMRYASPEQEYTVFQIVQNYRLKHGSHDYLNKYGKHIPGFGGLNHLLPSTTLSHSFTSNMPSNVLLGGFDSVCGWAFDNDMSQLHIKGLNTSIDSSVITTSTQLYHNNTDIDEKDDNKSIDASQNPLIEKSMTVISTIPSSPFQRLQPTPSLITTRDFDPSADEIVEIDDFQPVLEQLKTTIFFEHEQSFVNNASIASSLTPQSTKHYNTPASQYLPSTLASNNKSSWATQGYKRPSTSTIDSSNNLCDNNNDDYTHHIPLTPNTALANDLRKSGIVFQDDPFDQICPNYTPNRGLQKDEIRRSNRSSYYDVCDNKVSNPKSDDPLASPPTSSVEIHTTRLSNTFTDDSSRNSNGTNNVQRKDSSIKIGDSLFAINSLDIQRHLRNSHRESDDLSYLQPSISSQQASLLQQPPFTEAHSLPRLLNTTNNIGSTHNLSYNHGLFASQPSTSSPTDQIHNSNGENSKPSHKNLLNTISPSTYIINTRDSTSLANNTVYVNNTSTSNDNSVECHTHLAGVPLFDGMNMSVSLTNHTTRSQLPTFVSLLHYQQQHQQHQQHPQHPHHQQQEDNQSQTQSQSPLQQHAKSSLIQPTSIITSRSNNTPTNAHFRLNHHRSESDEKNNPCLGLNTCSSNDNMNNIPANNNESVISDEINDTSLHSSHSSTNSNFLESSHHPHSVHMATTHHPKADSLINSPSSPQFISQSITSHALHTPVPTSRGIQSHHQQRQHASHFSPGSSSDRRAYSHTSTAAPVHSTLDPNNNIFLENKVNNTTTTTTTCHHLDLPLNLQNRATSKQNIATQPSHDARAMALQLSLKNTTQATKSLSPADNNGNDDDLSVASFSSQSFKK